MSTELKPPKKRKHGRPGLKLMGPTLVALAVLAIAVAAVAYVLFHPRW